MNCEQLLAKIENPKVGASSIGWPHVCSNVM